MVEPRWPQNMVIPGLLVPKALAGGSGLPLAATQLAAGTSPPAPLAGGEAGGGALRMAPAAVAAYAKGANVPVTVMADLLQKTQDGTLTAPDMMAVMGVPPIYLPKELGGLAGSLQGGLSLETGLGTGDYARGPHRGHRGDDDRARRRAQRVAPPPTTSGPTIVGTPPCPPTDILKCLQAAMVFYGNAIDWNLVRIDYESNLAPANGAYVTGSTIHVDPSLPCPRLCEIIIHELAHVMSNQRGEHASSAAGISHIFGGDGLYTVSEQDLIDEDNSIRPCALEFGKERQAEVVQLFHDCVKNPSTHTSIDPVTHQVISKGARSPCPRSGPGLAALSKFAGQLLDPVHNPCPPVQRRGTGH